MKNYLHIFWGKQWILYWFEVAAVFFLFPYPYILAVVLACVSVFCFLRVYTFRDKVLYLCAFVMGPVAELASIALGAWVYSYPGHFVFPLWLPFAWGFVVVMITKIAESIALEFSKYKTR